MSDPGSNENKSDFKKRVSYQGGIVGVIALVASALLIAGHMQTKDAIAQRIDEDVQAMLNEVIPKELYDNNLLQDRLQLTSKEISTLTAPLEIYRARKEGEVTAVAYQVSEAGYSGAITSILAIDKNGKVLGVRVISHTETPGLGDKIEATRTPWVLAFNGLSLGNPEEARWGVKKDGGLFDQFSGATITPRAVVLSIKKGMLFFNTHRELLLDHQQEVTP